MITIRTNAAGVAKALEGAARQMPFATALALTRTAQTAQAEVRARLPDTFEIRNNWISKGIRISPARKASLEASVHTKDRFLSLHLQGGDRVPHSPGKDAVPVGARRNKRDFTRKATYPGKLLADNGKGYKAEIHPGVYGVFRRKGKGAKSRTTLMWLLVKKIEIKATWPFDEQVAGVVRQVLPGKLTAAIAEAIDTARRRTPAPS